jgi:TfoX/Sxy family transcriptional regulator of competence genes
MSMPRPGDVTKEFFRTITPADPAIETRPMFGQLAAFVNGNMFTGLFGDRIFVRLPAEARDELLAVEGAARFDPMSGRPLTEYVLLPEAWFDDPAEAQVWVLRAFHWVAALPPKVKKEKKVRGK